MNLLHTAHVPAGDGPFPTVLAIHGWGASAHDLLGLAPVIHRGEALVICPQGPVEVPVGGSVPGHGWFPLRPGAPPSTEEFRAGAERLDEFFDQALELYPVDRQRVALLGFSQGGAMAYALGLARPQAVAGIAGLSTWLPPDLASALPRQEAHQDLPVLVLHGTEDPLVPVERARESREALRSFGVSLTYREIAMAHEIRPEALHVLIDWLDRRVLAPSPR